MDRSSITSAKPPKSTLSTTTYTSTNTSSAQLLVHKGKENASSNQFELQQDPAIPNHVTSTSVPVIRERNNQVRSRSSILAEILNNQSAHQSTLQSNREKGVLGKQTSKSISSNNCNNCQSESNAAITTTADYSKMTISESLTRMNSLSKLNRANSSFFNTSSNSAVAPVPPPNSEPESNTFESANPTTKGFFKSAIDLQQKQSSVSCISNSNSINSRNNNYLLQSPPRAPMQLANNNIKSNKPTTFSKTSRSMDQKQITQELQQEKQKKSSLDSNSLVVPRLTTSDLESSNCKSSNNKENQRKGEDKQHSKSMRQSSTSNNNHNVSTPLLEQSKNGQKSIQFGPTKSSEVKVDFASSPTRLADENEKLRSRLKVLLRISSDKSLKSKLRNSSQGQQIGTIDNEKNSVLSTIESTQMRTELEDCVLLLESSRQKMDALKYSIQSLEAQLAHQQNLEKQLKSIITQLEEKNGLIVRENERLKEKVMELAADVQAIDSKHARKMQSQLNLLKSICNYSIKQNPFEESEQHRRIEDEFGTEFANCINTFKKDRNKVGEIEVKWNEILNQIHVTQAVVASGIALPEMMQHPGWRDTLLHFAFDQLNHLLNDKNQSISNESSLMLNVAKRDYELSRLIEGFRKSKSFIHEQKQNELNLLKEQQKLQQQQQMQQQQQAQYHHQKIHTEQQTAALKYNNQNQQHQHQQLLQQSPRNTVTSADLQIKRENMNPVIDREEFLQLVLMQATSLENLMRQTYC